MANTKKPPKKPASKAGHFRLQEFDPAALTSVPVTGWAAFINPASKQGSVRLVMGATVQDLPPMTDSTVASVVGILQSGNCFFDGTNVVTRHM